MVVIGNMKRNRKLVLYLFGSVLIVLNIIACFHAYKFTHFDETITQKPKDPKDLVFTEKLQALLLGVSLPRPQNVSSPNFPFSEITLNSNKKIVCWLSKIDNPKGTVILFHGYGGQKSKMIDKANEFIKLGYNTLLVDFMGSGKSEGNQTTIGFKEAEQVKTAFDYLESLGEKNIVLFGTSMGAAAILKAQNDYQLKAAKISLNVHLEPCFKL